MTKHIRKAVCEKQTALSIVRAKQENRIYEESEGIKMTSKKSDEKQVRQKQMNINGYKVTLSFSEEYNPNLSALVRSTLLDAYIRKNGLGPEERSS